MKPRILNTTLPAGRRIIAMSDIHANYEYLRGLLNKVNFTEDDILVIVGDMLEKGPESLRTLRYIMELSRRQSVYPVLGNCDEWSRAVDLVNPWSPAYVRHYIQHSSFRHPGLLQQMCDEIGFDTRGDFDLEEMKRQLRANFAEELAFLSSLPHLMETPNYTFVHGGLPEGDPETWDEWHCMKNDNFLSQERSFDKWQLVGHWPVVLYGGNKVCANPIILPERKIISIDGGCVLKDDGQLNALIIPEDGSFDFSFEYYDHFPTARVKSAQKESVQSYYIRWGDNHVEVLDWGAEFSRCRHLRTGYEMDILTKYLSGMGSDVLTNDCTDYVLPLSPGDRVSIVEITSRGYFVKHRGTSGWYFGELEF